MRYEFWHSSALVSPAISNARNSSSIFCKPSAHPLIRPGPLERMSVQLIVLRPRGGNMGDELLLIPPRPSPQVVVTKALLRISAWSSQDAWTGVNRGRHHPRQDRRYSCVSLA